jgi:hypothetical protein
VIGRDGHYLFVGTDGHYSPYKSPPSQSGVGTNAAQALLPQHDKRQDTE